ncbi:MAG TPA: hypothetical protein VKU00_24890 [Chthonomonadaceae bacterium]|nr:hypothetical protein [Chthonomonadaceae bacterium]
MISIKKFAMVSAALLAVAGIGQAAQADQSWNVTYTNTYGDPGALLISVSPTTGNPGPFNVLAYCVDRYDYVGVPSTASVQISTDPVHDTFTVNQYINNLWLNPNGAGYNANTAEAEWQRVSWIYDHYGKNAGSVGSVQAEGTQLAIWSVLGELGAYTNSYNQFFGAIDPTSYGTQVSNEYNTIMNASLNHSATDALYFARTPAGGYPGQALIAEVTPEGGSMWMLSMGTIPLVAVPLLRRRARKA